MISNILFTRIQRFISKDKSLPKLCKNKWIFNDVTIPCKCKDTCIYTNYSVKDWYEYCDKSYSDYCRKTMIK